MEVQILKQIQSIATPVWDAVFEGITMLGEQFLVVLVIAVLYWCIDKRTGKALIYALCTSAAVNGLFKGIVKRPRPAATDGIRQLRQETATGYSFPSGHSQNTAALWCSLLIRYRKWWIGVLGVLMMMGVGFSRLYLGAHFPTDVLAGLVLGALSATLCCILYQRVANKTLLFATTCLLFVPGLFFYASDVMMADYLKAFGLLIGLTVGNYVEEKWANFQTSGLSFGKMVLRFLLGLAGVGILYVGQKLLYPANVWLDTLRYFFIAAYAVGVHPVIIVKLHL